MSSKTTKPSSAKSSPASSMSVPTTKAAADAPKTQHRRSRTGCFTCRVRRKKCDETKPVCKACRHLNVECEYKKPVWWSHPERRRKHKEQIKEIIKQTKLNEKPSAARPIPPSTLTPPSLCHSLPTSEVYSESLARTRGVSIDSHFSPQFDLNTPQDVFNATPVMPLPQWTPMHPQMPHFSPYEVDVKTERQMFINDIPHELGSSVSTFSTFFPPPVGTPSQQFPVDAWVQHEYFESHNESFIEEPLDFNFFNFTHEPVTPSKQAVVHVEECDRPLLDHFLENVARYLFPILDINQHGSSRADVILPALESNKCYLHCCLSVSALHLKATQHLQGEEIDNDIQRHRFAAITELCKAFQDDTDHAQILEATLGLIFFQASVGSLDDTLPDIPWHQHFHAAKELLDRLEMENPLMMSGAGSQLPFNNALASWIDILGATMLQSVPVYANSYREKIESSTSSGLAELMGCDDRIMYLISEIACLDSIRASNGMDDMMLCTHITQLGEQITLTEAGPGELASVYSTTGAIRPKQVSKNITAIFRIAARIYLCSLVPAFDTHSASIVALVDSLTEAMAFIPKGPEGFDRCLVWPLLIAGSVSTPNSSFRKMFAERMEALATGSEFGSVGRVAELLKSTWQKNEEAESKGKRANTHWRDVMREKEWDFLLI